MSIPQVNVKIRLTQQDGTPFADATVSATLSHTEIYAGFVVPRRTAAATDAQGEVTLSLFPNEEGRESSHYVFRIPTQDARGHMTMLVVVPNMDCNLWDIVALPPFDRVAEIDIAAMDVYRLRAEVDAQKTAIEEMQAQIALLLADNSSE